MKVKLGFVIMAEIESHDLEDESAVEAAVEEVFNYFPVPIKITAVKVAGLGNKSCDKQCKVKTIEEDFLP